MTVKYTKNTNRWLLTVDDKDESDDERTETVCESVGNNVKFKFGGQPLDDLNLEAFQG